MARASIIRTHTGGLELAVSGQYVDQARVINIASNGDELVAVVHIPVKALTLEERDSVVPFKRRDE